MRCPRFLLLPAAIALLSCGWCAAAEVPVADLVKQFPAQDGAAAAEISAKLVAVGPAAVKEIASLLVEPGAGDDSKARIALHGLAVYVARPDAEAERKMFVETLAGLLGGEGHWLVKSFLIQQLQLAGGRESVAAIARFLPDENLCEFAAQALLAIRLPECADALRAALPQAKGGCRLTIVQALGVLRDAKAVPALLPAVADGNREMRLAALFALGNIGDPQAAEAMIKASAPESSYERGKATDALLLLAARLVEGDKRPDAERIYRHLLEARTSPQESHVRGAALRGLAAAIGEGAREPLMAALKSDQPDLAAVAADLAATVPGEAVTRALVDSLKDAEPAAKAAALDILARRGDKAALPAALEATKDADKAVRKAAIKAVGAAGKEEAIPALLEALGGADGDSRGAAAEALTVMAGGKVNDALVAALKAAPSDTKRGILGVLAARGDTAHLDALFACTADADAGVRSAALDALGVLGNDAALPRLLDLLVAAKGGELGAAEKAADAICRRAADREKCADALVAALAKAQGDAKCALLRVLGGTGSPKALEPLRAAFRAEDAEAQEASLRAMARWPNAAVAPELLTIAQNAKEPKHQVLALQGYLRLLGLPSRRPPEDSLRLYEPAMAAATRPEEKRQVLSAVAELRVPGALKLVAPCLGDKDLAAEAEAAAIKLAERLRDATDDAFRRDMRDALTAIAEKGADERRRSDARKALDRWYKEPDKP